MLRAQSAACLAGTAAVEDEQVAEHRPVLAGEERHQVELDLLRVGVAAEPEPHHDQLPRRHHHHALAPEAGEVEEILGQLRESLVIGRIRHGGVVRSRDVADAER